MAVLWVWLFNICKVVCRQLQHLTTLAVFGSQICHEQRWAAKPSKTSAQGASVFFHRTLWEEDDRCKVVRLSSLIELRRNPSENVVSFSSTKITYQSQPEQGLETGNSIFRGFYCLRTREMNDFCDKGKKPLHREKLWNRLKHTRWMRCVAYGCDTILFDVFQQDVWVITGNSDKVTARKGHEKGKEIHAWLWHSANSLSHYRQPLPACFWGTFTPAQTSLRQLDTYILSIIFF